MAVSSALLSRVVVAFRAHRIGRGRFLPLCRQVVALVAAASIVLQPTLAAAQVFSDKSAPGSQQAQIMTAGNGVPVVNITTPNGAGVSMNSYSQFNVGPTGLIFNNSRTPVQTQLGGWIAGNPWLPGGTAKLIVNQVTGNSPSLLSGFMEVGGVRADLVVANSSGITCNGCGFVNAARAVLTTGTPQFDTSGGLVSYDVRQGTVTVGGGGLDATATDYASILARAVQVNSAIWANTLTVVTGANQITPATRSSTPIAGTGDKPAFALDVAALGGMYAGKIKLIGTEAGVGVRNAGTIGAQAGQLKLSVNGSVGNSGTMQASSRVSVRANGSVTNSGRIYGQSATNVQATGTITNSTGGVIASGGRTGLAAATIRSNGLLAGGLSLDGTLAASGDLVVSAAGLAALGGINVAAGAINVQAAVVDVSSTPNTYGATSLTLSATSGDLTAANAVLGTLGAALITASGAVTTDGVLANVGLLDLAGASLSNDTGVIQQSSTGTARLAVTGLFANGTGAIVANGPMAIDAGALTSSGSLVSAGTLAIATGTLTNGGQIRSLAGLAVTTTGDVVNSGTIHAVGNAIILTIAGQISNTASGIIGSEANATLVGNAVTSNGVLGAGLRLNGTIGASGTLLVSAATTAAIHGEAVAPSSLSVVANSTDISGSPNLYGGGALVLDAQAGDLNATGAVVGSQGLALVQATGAVIFDSATMVVGSLNLFGDRLSSHGAMIEQASTTLGQIVLSQAFDNGSGAILSNGPLTIQATALTSSGALVSAGTMRLALASLHNSGSIRSLDRLDLATCGDIANTGTLYGATSGHLVVGGTLDNGAPGLIASAGNVSIAAATLSQSGLLAAGLDSAGKLGTSGDLTLTISGQASASGSTVAAGKMSLRADGISIASAPRVFAGSDLTLTATSGAIDATAASVASSGTLTISTPGAGIFDRAVVLADKLMLSAASLSNRQGTLQQAGAGPGSITLAGLLDNTGGQIVSNGSLPVGADSIANDGGRIAAAALLDVTANTLSGNGAYVSLANLGLTTPGAFTNTGTVQAGGAAILQIGGAFDNLSSILAGGTLLLSAPSIVNEPTGEIAGGAVGIFTQTFTNNQGSVGASGNLLIAADSHGALANAIVNDRGQIQSTSGDVVLLANGVQNLGTAPTFNHNGSQLVFYTSGASPPGDPSGLLNFMLLPKVVAANNQPATPYAAAYAKAFEELMAGKPLTADARAILDPSYYDSATGLLTARYAPAWAQLVAAGSTAGQSNMATLMKNMVDPTLFDSQGNIVPAAATAYAAFWIELSSGAALTSDVKAILKPSVLAADGTVLATYSSVWASIDAPSATPFTIKKVITSDTLNADGKMALIAAGGSISIAGGPVENLYSALSAGKDINIAASTFHNVALGASQTQFEVWKSSPCFSCHNAQIKFGQTFGGVVEAGGNVAISTQGSFVSETVPTSSTGVQDLAVISSSLAAMVQNLQPSLQATPTSGVATFDRLGVGDFSAALQGTGTTSGLPSNGAVAAAIDYAQSLGTTATNPSGAPASAPSQFGASIAGLGTAPGPSGSGAPTPVPGQTGVSATLPASTIAAQTADAQFFSDANKFVQYNKANRNLMQSSQPAVAGSTSDSINALAWLAASASAPSTNALFSPPTANELSTKSGGALISGAAVTLASTGSMRLDGVVDARTGLGLTSDADIMMSGYVNGGASAKIAAGGNLAMADTAFEADRADHGTRRSLRLGEPASDDRRSVARRRSRPLHPVEDYRQQRRARWRHLCDDDEYRLVAGGGRQSHPLGGRRSHGPGLGPLGRRLGPRVGRR